MLVVICPECETYLVEHGRKGKIDCMKCGNEFDSLQKEMYIPLNKLYEILKEKFYQQEVEKAKIKYKPQMTIPQSKALSFTQQNNLKMIAELKNKLKGEVKSDEE
jgi:uncharacterized Zn finger protein (UPF0148 family)